MDCCINKGLHRTPSRIYKVVAISILTKAEVLMKSGRPVVMKKRSFTIMLGSAKFTWRL